MEIESDRKVGRPANAEVRERRREEILAAAIKLFAERGYDRADTQMLADILGVGKGTIYRYFPSKRELFLAAVDSAMRELTVAVDEAVEAEEDPFQRMVCGMRAYLTFFAEHPEYVELIIQERAQFKDRKKPTYFEYRDTNRVRWRELFCSLIADGRLRDMCVDRVLDVLGDMLYGAMFTNYFVGRELSPDEQALDMLDITLHGILSDAERARWRSASLGAAIRGRSGGERTPGGCDRVT